MTLRQPAKSLLCLGAMIAVITSAAFANACAVASRLVQTSDSAYGFVVGHAIADGNIMLSGWHFPIDDYYFTDNLPYGVLEWLLGSQVHLLVVVPALTYALFVLAALFVCVDREKTFEANIVSCASVTFLLGAPVWIGEWNPLLLSDMHMASVTLAFVGLVLCARVANSERVILGALGLLIITSMTVSSDPFSLVFAFGPALAILLLDFAAPRGWRGSRLALVLLGAGIFVGFLLPWAIAQVGGFTTENDVLFRPQTFSLLLRNLAAATMGTFTLFGANPLLVETRFPDIALMVLRGAGLVLTFVVILRTLRSAFGRDQTPLLDRILCAGILTVFAACILSAQFAKGITHENLWTGGPPMRFLVPAYLFAVVIAGRRAPDIFSVPCAAWVRNSVVAGVAIIVLGGYWLSRLDERPQWIADNPPAAAARWLKQHGLLQGAGEYWSANLVTAISANAIQIRSVVPHSGRLVPYVWVEDARWYAKVPQFVIWQDGNKTSVTGAEVRVTYPVDHIATVAGYRIAILASGNR